MTAPDPASWRVYVITDEKLSGGRSHEEITRAAVEGGADVVQLRDKHSSNRRVYEAAVEMRRITREAGVAFIVNDAIDVALAVDADGVHLGDDDLPPDVARRLLGPGKLMGLSATTVEEALACQKAGADYLGVGPVHEARGTKPETVDPRGESFVSRIAETVDIPFVAIGGLNAGNASATFEAGAPGVAVVSGVVTADDIAEATRALVDIAKQHRR